MIFDAADGVGIAGGDYIHFGAEEALSFTGEGTEGEGIGDFSDVGIEGQQKARSNFL